MSRRVQDSYRPRRGQDSPPPPLPRQVAADMYRFGGPSHKPHDFSFRSRISQRDLLTQLPSTTEPQNFVPDMGGHKFRNIDDMTDSEEEAMDEDSDDAEDRHKRRKLDDSSADMTRPKWSNPDPYTSLPPAPEPTGKRVNVVKLIRKARNDQLNAQSTTANEDDFISLDNIDGSDLAPPKNAPTGPKNEVVTQASVIGERVQSLGKRKRGDNYDSDTLLGNRHRGAEYHANGQILAKWQSSSNVSPAPWLQSPNLADSPIVALHKEVLDFYSWVKPHEVEYTVREDLIQRLSHELRRWRPGELKSFGSYAAGLYLPTGDMDLVYNINGFIVTSKKMYELGAFLDRNGLTAPGSVKVIGKAKVPIIKFVDNLTGLRVDLSFNNNTGIIAIDTFQKWQALYPALPIIVAVVKQFLMIRGLNDNSVGGFGGFATICMVTCLIQNLPAHKHHNLGELLVEFFNLYGNLIDVKNVGIRLDPPGFIDKRSYSLMRDERPERLMIIDPNLPENNITGGSNEVRRIFHIFSKTYELLLNRLDDFASPEQQSPDFSFLSTIIGGDFTAYYEQRRQLHAVYQRMYPNSDVPPPEAPPSQLKARKSAKQANTTGDDDSSNKARSEDGRHQKTKGQRRLERIRRLFPALIPQLSTFTTLTVPQALDIGGWTDNATMLAALDEAERAS